ncbi:hypothetical protein V8F20_007106 [Naviculisporaceae sp. PSN 640]
MSLFPSFRFFTIFYDLFSSVLALVTSGIIFSTTLYPFFSLFSYLRSGKHGALCHVCGFLTMLYVSTASEQLHVSHAYVGVGACMYIPVYLLVGKGGRAPRREGEFATRSGPVCV